MTYDKLLSVNLSNKEELALEFSKAVRALESNKEITPSDSYKIRTVNNKFGKVIYLVPNQLIELFEEMNKEHPEELLGYAVQIKDVRVSCFGVPCSMLAKGLIK